MTVVWVRSSSRRPWIVRRSAVADREAGRVAHPSTVAVVLRTAESVDLSPDADYHPYHPRAHRFHWASGLSAAGAAVREY
jgi:hypothetical protein